MTTILSLPAIARLAERQVRTDGPTTATDLIAWLVTVDVERTRAEAGVRLAVMGGRLALDRGGVLAIPTLAANAASATPVADRSPAAGNGATRPDDQRQAA